MWGFGPDATRPKTDATHRANFRYACGVILIAIFLASTACSSKVVHEPDSQTFSRGEININTATIDELEKLPHIGRKTAEAIVEFREQNGPFRRVEHLMQIRGISEQRFLDLRPFIKTE
ncbi:MAG: helix-hairpin-helix domain-containing protein [Pyrinomonadaceae bacterium]